LGWNEEIMTDVEKLLKIFWLLLVHLCYLLKFNEISNWVPWQRSIVAPLGMTL
jgi:hypothetical protein